MTYGPFDKQLELRDIADGAETATATEEGLTLPVRMAGDFKAIFYVSALDDADADETYTLDVLVADTKANLAGSGVEVASIAISSAGAYEVPLSGNHIERLDADAGAITCRASLGGTTPSITYGCFLAPAV